MGVKAKAISLLPVAHRHRSYQMQTFMDQRLPPEHLVCGHEEQLGPFAYTTDNMKAQFLVSSYHPPSVH